MGVIEGGWGFGAREVGVQLVAQSRTRLVALGKSLGTFNTSFPHLNYGHKITYRKVLWGGAEVL